MPKLRNMLGETGTIEIPVPGDDPLIVTYRRASLTPRMQSRLAEAQATARTEGADALAGREAIGILCEFYARAIVSWNLTDDDGQPLGTDAESLQDVDFSILNLITDEIGKAVRPDPLSDSGSNNGSTPGADQEPRRIGMAS